MVLDSNYLIVEQGDKKYKHIILYTSNDETGTITNYEEIIKGNILNSHDIYIMRKERSIPQIVFTDNKFSSVTYSYKKYKELKDFPELKKFVAKERRKLNKKKESEK